MRYNKFVRDKIPEIIRAEGREPLMHVADEIEYDKQLERKLEEEVAEFLKDKTAEELADILEVVYALGETMNISKENLEALRLEKFTKKGGFSERIILEEA